MGRFFDGTDDKCQKTSAPSWASDTSGSMFWRGALAASTTDYAYITMTEGRAWDATNDEFRLWFNDLHHLGYDNSIQLSSTINGTVSSGLNTGANTITDTDYHDFLLVSSGTSYTLYIDAVSQSWVVLNGSNNGNWFGDHPDVDRWTIGGLQRDTLITDFNGDMKDVVVWSSQLGQTEATALSHGISPFAIDPANQRVFHPLEGNESPESDYHGQTDTLTVTGAIKSTTNPATELLENYL